MPNIPPFLLPAIRIAIGGCSWAAPEQTAPIFGFKPDPDAAYLARLFGIRDVILGLGQLTAGAESKRTWYLYGIVCDAADAAAGVIGLKSGGSKRAMISSTATASLAVGLGVIGLLGAGSGKQPADES